MIGLSLMAAASLAGLKPGGVVKLPAGEVPMVTIRNMKFDPPVVIDANGSVVRGVVLMDVEGVVWRGGTIVAPGGLSGKGPAGYAMNGRRVSNVRFEGTSFTKAARGMVVSDSHGFAVANSRFFGLRTDGINFVGGSRLVIDGNDFREFNPNKPTGNKADGNWVDGDHPDAIQFWVTKETPYGRDYSITRNVIEGDTQGISFFGPSGDGYSDVRVTDNVVKVTFPAGISVNRCTECVVTGNDLQRLPGAKYKANMRLDGSVGRFCGNKVRDVPKHEANVRC